MFKQIQCQICQKTFSGQINGSHLKLHGLTMNAYEDIYGLSRDPDLIKFCSDALHTNREKAKTAAATKRGIRITDYNQNPKCCEYCNLPFDYDQRQKRFCSHSCSAKHNNQKRLDAGWTMPTEARAKISESVKDYVETTNDMWIRYPYSKIYQRKCKFCRSDFFGQFSGSIVCPNCQHLKWANNKNSFSFRFNVYDYPELFDLELLKSVGWVSFGGKRGGKKNPNGLSRDHRVSIDEAKRNGYEPYYISHPINCDLITMIENNKKKTKSSISYQQLKNSVDLFDMGAVSVST